MDTRTRSRWGTRLLALVLVAALLVTPVAALSQYDIYSTGAYMLDAATGEELFAKNEDTRLVPASITKLMTIYLVYEAMAKGQFTENSIVPISYEISAFSTGPYYSNVPLYTWGTYTVSQLLDAVILSSGCAATRALGLMVNPNEQEFIALMNQTARELGIDCSYVDAFGGSSANRVTAKGVAVLCYNLLKKYPGYLDHSRKPYYYINGNCYYTTNQFVKGYYSCDGTVDGIKTGTNSAAGYCLSVTAYKEDLRVIAVVLQASADYYRHKDAQNLMNYGLDILSQRKAQGWRYADAGSMTVTVGAKTYTLPTYLVDGTTCVCPGDLALMVDDTSAAFGYEVTADRLQLTRGVEHTGTMTARGTKKVMAPPTGKTVYLGDAPSEFPSYQISGNAYVPLEALLALLEMSAEISMDGKTMVIHVADLVDPFNDVYENAWYAEAVSYVSSGGIMQGTGYGSFSPETELTRAMMAQVFYNLAGRPEIEQPPEEPPIGGETPPAEGEEPPVQGEEPPVQGEELPVEGEEPPTEGETPPVEGEEPPAEGETPPVEGEEPPTEGETPPVEGETPPVEGETPPVEGEESPVEGEEPPVEGEEPPTEGETPPVEGETPPVEGETPPVEGETPPVEGEEPPVEGEEPPTEGETPPVEGEEPSTEPTGPIFTDVEAGKWYEKAVLWAASVGLVKGRGEGIFDPHANITRQEMVTMIYRYEAYLGNDTSARADLSAFADSGSINKFARNAMEWAVAEGVIRGMTSTTIAPRGTATRAQVAQVMMNCGY